jgi:putative acetyltransferase
VRKPPEALVIGPEPYDSPDSTALVAALDAYLGTLYPPEENFLELPAEDLEAGRGVFLVARMADRALGCGAVRLLASSTGEIKRLYVSPDARNGGVAKAVLAELEGWAAGRGVSRLVLETGNRQAEAIGLYRSAGYAPIPCFGAYAGSPSSVCFEKHLFTGVGVPSGTKD